MRHIRIFTPLDDIARRLPRPAAEVFRILQTMRRAIIGYILDHVCPPVRDAREGGCRG